MRAAVMYLVLSLPLCVTTVHAGERVLKFPPEQALGVVYVRDPQPPRSLWSDWVRIGPAQGEVRIPAGKAVRFDPSPAGAKDLSALASLNFDDLDMVLSSENKDRVDVASIARLKGLRVLVLRSSTIDEEQIRHLGSMQALEELALGSSTVTDQHLQHLVRLPNLRHIELWRTRVTDAGLEHLAKILSLEEIELNTTDVGDTGMSHLASMPHLRRLSVEETDVGDEGLRALAASPTLESLNIMRTPATDDGLAHLAKMKLKDLFLMPAGTMSDAGMAHVGKITTLQRLWLPSSLTDAGVRHLANLKSLRDISLPADLTDAGIADLAKLTTLETVAVGGEKLTDEGISKLTTLPRLRELRAPIGPITLQKLAANAKNIESLSLKGPQIMPAHLNHLAAFNKLKRLYLNDLDLRGAAMDGVAGAKSVEFIQMFDVHLDDGSLARLATMPALKRLLLPFRPASEITDAGVQQLCAAKTLVQLDLFGKGLTDETLKALGTLPKLEILQTSGEFTDAGLAHLEGMPALEALFLPGRNFTPRALDRLRQTTPSLQRLHAETGKAGPNVQLKPGDPAPAFEVKTFDGKTVALDDLSGKVVMLHFWATWCAPCVASTGYVKEIHEELSENQHFAMISISIDDVEHLPRRHAQRHALAWPQAVVGLRGKIADDYGIKGVARLVVIGPDGKILLGGGSYGAAREAAKKALHAIAVEN